MTSYKIHMLIFEDFVLADVIVPYYGTFIFIRQLIRRQLAIEKGINHYTKHPLKRDKENMPPESQNTR
jgi:hypothetical protein